MTDASETDASFLAPVFGAGFWSVCHGHKIGCESELFQCMNWLIVGQFLVVSILQSPGENEIPASMRAAAS